MKKFLVLGALCLSFVLAPFQSQQAHAYETQFDDASKIHISKVFALLEEHSSSSDTEKLDMISAYFKDVPYVANRLVGDASTPEQLVLALDELDCFTYVDYIEAFKRSTNESEFIKALINVRYIDGQVSYLNRKHFFSDWFAENEVLVKDVLTEPQYASVVKTETVDINKGANGEYIKGLPDRKRDINYIPRDSITPELLKTFKTGDYVGLRTKIAGLDVTHCGIIIQKEDGTYMRHASSQKAFRKVIDQKLEDYFTTYKSPTGILVFRSTASFSVKTVPDEKAEMSSDDISPTTTQSSTILDTALANSLKKTSSETLANTSETTSSTTLHSTSGTTSKKLPKTGDVTQLYLAFGILLILVAIPVFSYKNRK